MIDTHTHLDGEEFRDDLPEVIQRAKDAGVEAVFVPAINLASVETVLNVCWQYPDYAYPMIGLHPEDVRENWREELAQIKCSLSSLGGGWEGSIIAIGEVGLDFYWSREFEKEQLLAFEEQIRWSVETGLPLMIHCRKAQNEMVSLLKKYKKELPGGVFHCFTGNAREAEELLQFENFVLGIGGVLTFKKSHLPEVLPTVVPLNRIVIETDSPYMAPVPYRGKRNESAYVKEVLMKLAELYAVTPSVVEMQTNANVSRVFNLPF